MDIACAASVLVVEDADDIRALLEAVLARAGLRVASVATGRECLAVARASPPDLVVLDLGLPDGDGIEICRQLRAEHDCWVLMLTGRTDEADLLVGLAVGADGFMTKPFSPREVVARVQAMLRRRRPGATVVGAKHESAGLTGSTGSAGSAGSGDSAGRGGSADSGGSASWARSAISVGAQDPELRTIGELTVHEGAREARVAGVVVELTKTEFDLLVALSFRVGRVMQRETLLREVWDTDWEGNLRLVEAHMSNLRRKLVSAGMRVPSIQTVRGVGYRLVR